MIKGIGVDICDLRRLNHLDQLAKKILHFIVLIEIILLIYVKI